MGVYNQSHQRDTTAYRALCNIDRDIESRYTGLIAEIHALARRAKMEIVGPIKVRDIKSGKICR